ncbi:acetate and sugar kinases/Hsc70/actin family protein [Mesobaculum littorinae]|uniref:hypothetical protein n=1 Tax=Mesobaculum littorinae TaxID=2486419 RepID=UPI001F379969|nr:hypothetical protein [Mesobaculum littorinae]
MQRFDAPLDVLPDPRPSDSRFGETAAGATAVPARISVLSMLGYSHAAPCAHGVRGLGEENATYGTGSSLLTQAPRRTASRNGLSGTIAWSGGQTAYARKGNTTVSAQAAAFAAGKLGLTSVVEVSAMAQTVPAPAIPGAGREAWADTGGKVRAEGLCADFH